MDEGALDVIDRRVKKTIEAAIRFAQESPQPAPWQILTDVYVGFPESEIWPFQTAAVEIRRSCYG